MSGKLMSGRLERVDRKQPHDGIAAKTEGVYCILEVAGAWPGGPIALRIVATIAATIAIVILSCAAGA
ncbi:uncharacterized protein UV8b_08297 [Ustilaginoidea virens]|uniref:Uncharacterized protein n=1 Tax=Ustilaginoidea virens TaxID=1159556 RepID=A0A8E5HYV1_USTVR|nr:uncharacterized protein UV8b_08297 [Ustilaginoidea virens]QUC24056.1 hypothetical protein UV8b_08297 [Ustilaginoidea virens]